jgi:Domain of unknown function (DUF4349)
MNITARRAGGSRAVVGDTAVSRTVASCAALLAGAGLLLVTACSGSSATPSSASAVPAGAAFGGAVPVPSAGPAQEQLHAAASGAQPAADQAARLAPASQSIIYTANMTVRVRDAMAAAASAASAAAAAGGYTAGEQAQAGGRGQRPQVSLTLKVPVPSYPATLAALGRLGRQTALNQQATDVTEQVADVSSLVTSQEDEIAQLQVLLSRAGSVTDLLQVQDQLSSDESNLEALQAQQRALDHETAYATVSVLLLGPLPRAAAHRAAAHGGFGSGLAAGWHGFVRATVWLLTALGVVLPFAVVLALLSGLGYAGRRRLARLARRRPRPTASGEA